MSKKVIGPNTVLTDKYVRALEYANTLHGASVRKGTDITYMCHLLSVSALVLEAGGSQDQAIAGLLHDAVEDAGGLPRLEDIRIKFGCDVADIVKACSDSTDEEWKKTQPYSERKKEYLEHLADPSTSSSAVLVSIADKVHNARATVTDLERVGVAVLSKFNASGPQEILAYYQSLLQIAVDRNVPSALVLPFKAAVDRIAFFVNGPSPLSLQEDV